MDAPGDVLVMHRAALGDFVLTWPLLRSLAAAGRRVGVATDRSKAQLAARELGVMGIDIEQRRFNDLWLPGRRPEAVPGVARVISFLADPRTDAGSVWVTNARAMFPWATVEVYAQRVDRRLALRLAGPLAQGAGPARRSNPGGPIVAHVGAGSRAKMWPLARWAVLAEELAADPIPGAVFLAGEAEAERFTAEERVLFASIRGRYVATLPDLADVLRGARLFVGCDSGPTHLAAQLGVPTVALFGPTDPALWAPVGPDVRVIAPERPVPMEWLETERVAAELRC